MNEDEKITLLLVGTLGVGGATARATLADLDAPCRAQLAALAEEYAAFNAAQKAFVEARREADADRSRPVPTPPARPSPSFGERAMEALGEFDERRAADQAHDPDVVAVDK